METLFLFKDFDEPTYLKNNPDVSEAVVNQSFASGTEHFLKYGIFEDRPGVPEVIKDYVERLNFEIKNPPNKLRLRVHGNVSLQEFIKAGKFVSFNLYSAILTLSCNMTGNRILDFGCGCGRVISYLSKLLDNNHLYGCDIDNEAISWCQSYLQHIGEFRTNKPFPNLPYKEDYFDIVYSISVFTHLPEDMQFKWLKELKRVTRKGGYLLLTTHGEHLAPKQAQKIMQEHGFYYSVGDNTDGLPDFYQTTYHTDQYINDHWQDYFDIIKIVKKGILNHQDFVICRNDLE